MNKQQVTESFIRAQRQYYSPPLRASNPTCTYQYLQDSSGLPYLPLSITVPVDIIAQEINTASHLLTPHRQDYDSQGWSSFCLHGRSIDQTLSDEFYTTTIDHNWTPEAVEFMPNTVEWLKTEWPHGSYDRVRVMCLEPGGWILPHRDYEKRRLGPINIAVTQPDDCGFYTEDIGKVPFANGSAMWMDVSRRHAVINNSNQPRYHMIIHQTTSRDWERLVLNSYKDLPCKD